MRLRPMYNYNPDRGGSIERLQAGMSKELGKLPGIAVMNAMDPPRALGSIAYLTTLRATPESAEVTVHVFEGSRGLTVEQLPPEDSIVPQARVSLPGARTMLMRLQRTPRDYGQFVGASAYANEVWQPDLIPDAYTVRWEDELRTTVPATTDEAYPTESVVWEAARVLDNHQAVRDFGELALKVAGIEDHQRAPLVLTGMTTLAGVTAPANSFAPYPIPADRR